MAPPRIRQTGHSRRAQFSAFIGYAIAGLAALLGAALLLISLFEPSAFAGLRGLASDGATQPARIGAYSRAQGRGIWETVTDYVDAADKNAALRRELQAARVELVEARAIRAENARLKALLDLREEGAAPPVASARMVGATSSSIRRFAYLPVGRAQGIEPGMPVVSGKGLVGRILETGRNSARILLLNDLESLVPVRRAGDDVVALAEGRADGGLRIRLVNLGINPLKKGDIFVTSGAGGLFRPGIPVAIVQEVTGDGANALLLSDPAATDYVSILPVWNTELRRAALTGQLPGEAAPPPQGASAE